MGIFHCHCSRCRKARGTAHATNMLVPIDGFHYLRGEDLLTYFKPPQAARFKHVFCGKCGSSLPNIDRDRGFVVVPMGSLDADPPPCVSQHIYVGSKAGWEVVIEDGLPRHDAGPNTGGTRPADRE